MDLQLRNSIYQCNPRCSIEKRTIKTPSVVPASTRALKTTEYTTQLLDKFERDRGDKHELQRNNYLNETVSTLNTMDIFTTNSTGYSVPI